MLFRRFALVALSIAIMGILLSNLIEATQSSKRGFVIDQRVNEWITHDAHQACRYEARLCANLTAFQQAI